MTEKEEKLTPLDVKIINKDKSERDTTYDTQESDEYEENKMTDKDIEEFEKDSGNTSS